MNGEQLLRDLVMQKNTLGLNLSAEDRNFPANRDTRKKEGFWEGYWKGYYDSLTSIIGNIDTGRYD